MGNWVFVPPFVLLFALLGLCGYNVLRFELAARCRARHRGVYAPIPSWRSALERGLAGSNPRMPNLVEMVSLGEFVNEVRVFGIAPAPENVGVAYITLTPDTGVSTLPALTGSPPLLTMDDIERFNAEETVRRDAELERVVESLVQRHERLYHPLAA